MITGPVILHLKVQASKARGMVHGEEVIFLQESLVVLEILLTFACGNNQWQEAYAEASVKDYWDYYSTMKTTNLEGRSEGRAEGLAEGLVKGRAEDESQRHFFGGYCWNDWHVT